MQQNERKCRVCWTPLANGQVFCPKCGSRADADEGPTFLTPSPSGPSSQGYVSPYGPGSDSPSLTPPPNPATLNHTSPHGPGSGGPPPYPFQPGQQPLAYGQPMKDSSKSILAQIGCGMGAVILAVVLLCGGLAYGGYWLFTNMAQSTGNSSLLQTGSSVDPTSTEQVIARTIPINATITYASDEITIQNVQQTPSVLRVNLNERNTDTKARGGFLFTDSVHLILPDNSSIAVDKYLHDLPPSQQSTQTNWLEFPLQGNIATDQAVLRLGTASEEQMDIPLKEHADVSRYQAKTVQLSNAQATYEGVQWKISAATLSWSVNGSQAATGQLYVTLDLRFDNTTTQAAQGYWGDYVRLKAGDSTNTPTTDTSIPLSFEAGQTGQTGRAFFSVPQGVTSFTLILLGPPQSQIPFQIA